MCRHLCRDPQKRLKSSAYLRCARDAGIACALSQVLIIDCNPSGSRVAGTSAGALNWLRRPRTARRCIDASGALRSSLGSSGAHRGWGVRATASIEEIWCQKIRGCSCRGRRAIPLLDQFVGSGKQTFRNRRPRCFRCLEADNEARPSGRLGPWLPQQCKWQKCHSE